MNCNEPHYLRLYLWFQFTRLALDEITGWYHATVSFRYWILTRIETPLLGLPIGLPGVHGVDSPAYELLGHDERYFFEQGHGVIKSSFMYIIYIYIQMCTIGLFLVVG